MDTIGGNSVGRLPRESPLNSIRRIVPPGGRRRRLDAAHALARWLSLRDGAERRNAGRLGITQFVKTEGGSCRAR